MKPASPALIALLATGKFYIADLYTITLSGGQVLRYTGAQSDLTVGGNTYASASVQRDAVKLVVGITVDTCNVVLAGQTFPAMVASGAFDGARVVIERLYMATYGDTSAGALHVFSGRVADASSDRLTATLSVVSDTELLNTMVPRQVFQPTCWNTLFDAECGVSAAAYLATATVQAGSTYRTLLLNAVPAQARGGVLTITSGALAGTRRTISGTVTGGITIALALPSIPAAGVTVSISPGCNKTLATCTAAYNNAARFRGQPYIPTPVTAV